MQNKMRLPRFLVSLDIFQADLLCDAVEWPEMSQMIEVVCSRIRLAEQRQDMDSRSSGTHALEPIADTLGKYPTCPTRSKSVRGAKIDPV